MRVAAILALAFAVMLGAAACHCGERGDGRDGHHRMMSCPMAQPMMHCPACGKMMQCPMAEQMMYCPMCGRMMVCPQCREMAEHKGMGERGERQPVMACPMCSPTMDKESCNEAMERMGMAAQMRMHALAMLTAKMTTTDPAKLMAMEEHLKLTKDQMDKLQKIQKDAAAQAEALLTPDQKALVEKMKEMPPSMMALHKHMQMMMMQDGAKEEPKDQPKGDMK